MRLFHLVDTHPGSLVSHIPSLGAVRVKELRTFLMPLGKIPPIEEVFEVPTDVINGIRMHYEVYGEGTPIVFIHPPVTPGSCFSKQVDYLQQQFQVITLDLRGHCETEPSPQPFSFTLLAEDIEQLG